MGCHRVLLLAQHSSSTTINLAHHLECQNRTHIKTTRWRMQVWFQTSKLKINEGNKTQFVLFLLTFGTLWEWLEIPFNIFNVELEWYSNTSSCKKDVTQANILYWATKIYWLAQLNLQYWFYITLITFSWLVLHGPIL